MLKKIYQDPKHNIVTTITKRANAKAILPKQLHSTRSFLFFGLRIGNFFIAPFLLN
tara:strand:+ start:56 stop:223 length:168 start_codon:yes stop_codon:yes gene_type:complete